MLKRLILAACLLVAAPIAHAQNTWPTPQTSTGGPTVMGGVGLCLNGSNQAVPCSASTPQYTILSPGTSAIGYVGGFNVFVPNTPTVQNAAYSASNAIGGFQQIALFRNTAQPGGLIDYVAVTSKGGSTTALTIYAFNKSSANLSSTCTDKSAFSFNAADVSALIPGFPVTLTPAAMQGTTITNASQALATSTKNADSTPSLNITLCAVVGGSVTPASTSDLVFDIGIVQD